MRVLFVLGIPTTVLCAYVLGRRTGFKAGHDAVVAWSLEHGAMPANWSPDKDWAWE